MGSGDKIRYFFEEGAEIGPEADPATVRASINKIGHALHDLNPVFARFSFSQAVREVLGHTQLDDPVLVQSMYIVKPPRIGGVVAPHQDASFLIDEPQTVTGLWFALEDATVDNGCLWVLPGSHRDPLHARFARKANNPQATAMDGEFPPFDEETYTPLEVQAGSLVLLHGSVLHASKANTSSRSRHAYTLHFKSRASTWSPDNWLQSPDRPFHGWESMPHSL